MVVDLVEIRNSGNLGNAWNYLGQCLDIGGRGWKGEGER
jgi:hypothetical protein